MSLYCFACGHISIAFQLLYRARYLALLCHGEDHPEIAQIDVNIALMLHAVEEFETSVLFIQNALRLNKKYVMHSISTSAQTFTSITEVEGALVHNFRNSGPTVGSSRHF